MPESEGHSQRSDGTRAHAASSLQLKIPANLEVLKRDNYRTWAFRTKKYLQYLNLWEVVRPLEPSDSDAVDRDSDEQAHTIITMWLDNVYLVTAEKETTARGLWRALHARHEDASVASVLYLQRQLVNMRMLNTEKLEDCFDRAERLHADLHIAGETMSEHSVVLAILRGLPADYAAAVAYLGMSSQPLKFSTALRKLQNIEQQVEADNQYDHNALYARTNKPQGERKCWHCNIPGHMKRNCPKLLPREERARGNGANTGGVAL
jgi:gag-polypeptide of LTR copia-type/Zinc knuckle